MSFQKLIQKFISIYMQRNFLILVVRANAKGQQRLTHFCENSRLIKSLHGAFMTYHMAKIEWTEF